MKIKRFTGTNTREVLARIRNDLGPDAVILSNREIVGGVELMAAVDFDANQIQAEAASADPAAPETTTAATSRGLQPGSGSPAAALRQTQAGSPLASPQAAAARSANAAPPLQRAAAPVHHQVPTAAVAPRVTTVPPPMSKAAPQAATHPAPQASATSPGSASDARSAAQPAWSGEIRELRDEVQELRQWVLSSVAKGGPQAGEPAISPLVARLQGLGFSLSSARAMAGGGADLPAALTTYLQGLDMPSEPLAEDGIYALVGATGVGKTTTIAKLAARLVLRHGTAAVALITTDTYRIGGVEQLKIYGRILGVPVAVARDAAELEQHLQEFADRRFVLIDTIGLSPRDARLAEQMQWLQACGERITRLLLINAGMSQGFYAELWKLYQHLPVAACILTKLDETPAFGAALQWLVEQGLPLWFYTDGQRVPEDLHAPALAKIAALLQSDRAEHHTLAPAGQEPARAASSR
ncbi:putative Flagellar GTP-binding protein [Thiomonas sp. X19]|uniref:flagellar biosynthesis protein FlhF n=1 Tax=Thiomonas sp. X19 TaxID=1050370 RepID=UPI000B6A68BF|nr:flagellar biosynthesis protein FlhF [Thiomonas sp. X19]SCC91129.1 putative Flagellar GTP-binding protein [Thiomonas sp. X19]